MGKILRKWSLFCLAVVFAVLGERQTYAGPALTGSADFVNSQWSKSVQRFHFDWDQRKFWIDDFHEVIGLSTLTSAVVGGHSGSLQLHKLDDETMIVQTERRNEFSVSDDMLVGILISESNGDLVDFSDRVFQGKNANRYVQRAPVVGSPPLDPTQVAGTWTFKYDFECNGCTFKIDPVGLTMDISGRNLHKISFSYVGTPSRGTLTMDDGVRHFFFFLDQDHALSGDFGVLVRQTP